MRKLLGLVLMSGVAACNGVPETDARALVAAASNLKDVDPAMRSVLLISACMEIPSCAGDCKSTLEAIQSAAPADRVGLIASGCDQSAASLPRTRDGLDQWIEGYVSAYAKRARASLPEADRATLDAVWPQNAPK